MAGQGQGAGTAASGGKGGSYGGPKLPTSYPMPSTFPSPGGGNTPNYGVGGGGGKGGQQPSGGKGGAGSPQTFPGLDSGQPQTLPSLPSGSLPDESGGVQTLPATPEGPNGFEQGLNAMNQGMDWFGNQLNYQGPKLGGDYGVGQLDAKSYLSQMGQAGGGGYTASMMTAPGRELYDYDAAQAQGQSYNAAQLSDKNINDYMNPYTQSVIDTTMADLDKARQQALNSTGAAATAGGAFGGDRHGIMEAQNNADFMDQVARSSAQLRNQGYQNAQAAAMGDVNALNQSYASNAGMAQQAGLANQAAQNARSQFVGGTANQNAMQTGLANQQASNAAKALGAQLNAQASIANANSKNALLGQLMGYDNSNQQFNAGMNFSKDQFNASQDQQQFMNQMSAAQQMYGMGNDRWQMGQDAVNSMSGVGNQIDQINQGYLNSIQDMFMNQQNAPQDQFKQMIAAMSGQPNWGGTQSYNPGFFDYAGLGAGVAGSWLGGKT